jgi:aminopeptidase N
VVNDDAAWWRVLRAFYQRFKYQNILTEDVVAFFNREFGRDLTAVFDQYLRRAALPTLELAFREEEGTVSYRWKADERAFRMPIRMGAKDRWQTITPTTEWQTMPLGVPKETFDVPVDLYYVNVTRTGG